MTFKPGVDADVSVVIPTYNSSATLGRTLDSVYAQSSPVREIIVVDDGSDDWKLSRQIVEGAPTRIPVHWLRLEENQGVSAARNAGIAAARGRYLAFLDSDDVWFEEKIAIQHDLMSRNQFDFSMHRYHASLQQWPMNPLEKLEVQDPGEALPVSFSRFSRWTPLLRNDSTNTVMVLREKMVRYDPALRRGEDFKCYMELLARGCRGGFVRRVLAGGFKSTIGAGGLSQDVEGMHQGRIVGLERLIAEGKISRLQYLVGIGLETVKYPIRSLLVRLRNQTADHHAKPETASV